MFTPEILFNTLLAAFGYGFAVGAFVTWLKRIVRGKEVKK